MLRYFRSGGVAQVLIPAVSFAIIVVFALEFRAGRGGPTATLKRECVIELDSACVDGKEYFAAFGLIVPRAVEPRVIRALHLRRRVLDGLVERELLAADGQRLGIAVGADAVEDELVHGRAHVSLPAAGLDRASYELGLCRPSKFGSGCEPGTDMPVRYMRVRRTPTEPFDYKLYEREVRVTTNRGPKEFKEMQERELVAARVRALVRSRVRIPESEAWFLFERARSTVVVRSAVLKRDWFAKFAVDQSEGNVERWASANATALDTAWANEKSQYSAGCPLVSEITLDVSPGASDAEKAESHDKLAAARARIAKGEAFESVAREVSTAPSAVVGGALGCLSAAYGEGSEELLKAAAALKPGELSPLIQSPRGVHLLRLDGTLTADKLEQVGRNDVARRLYADFAAGEKQNAFASELIQRAKAGAKLEDALQALTLEFAGSGQPRAKAAPAGQAHATANVDAASQAADRPKIDISAPFSISGNPLPDVEPKEPLAARAFELKDPGDVYATPIATADGAVVLQLKEKDPVKREEFEKQRDNILAGLLEAKASDALARYVAELRRQAGSKLKVDERFGEDKKPERNDDE